MRWLLDFFREQDLGYQKNALSPQDKGELDLFDLQAQASHINRLMTSAPEEAQEQIDRIHRPYWSTLNNIKRAKIDLTEQYSGFMRQSKCSNTLIGGFGTAVISYLLDTINTIEIPDGCPESQAYSTLSKTLGIFTTMLALQLLHHLNYQSEVKQIKSSIQTLTKDLHFYKTILEKTKNTELLEQDPEIEDEIFNPR